MKLNLGINTITRGLPFRFGVLLACGLIWTSAAVGVAPLFPGAQYAAGYRPSFVAIGDLDGDQVPDMVVANSGVSWTGDTVSVMLGVGDGTFTAAVHYSVGHGPSSVAIGDLDGDQVPDLVVTNSGGSSTDDNVYVLLGLGDGTFSTAVSYAAGYGALSVAIGDLDGDQVPDLAVANSGWAGSISVLLGLGDGTFAAAVDYADGDTPRTIAIGDLDGDQIPDLTVANTGLYSGEGNVSVLLGVGDGTFAAPVNYAAGIMPASLAIGDLNGDQVPDLAVADVDSDNVSVLLGVGDGTFGAAADYATGPAPVSVAIGDLDGDQVLDLAVTNRGRRPYYTDASVSVLLGVGDGTFAAAVHYAAGREPFFVAIGDLDCDAVPDLAVGQVEGYYVSVLLGVGDGVFSTAPQLATGDKPHFVAIGDLNGDRVPDLAVANLGSYPLYDDGNVSVLLGVGDGTFAATAHYNAGDTPRSVVIGDLDGDQIPDLAVANSGTDPTWDGYIAVLLGVGDGTFATAVYYPAGNRPGSIVIGDLDGDQVPDLAVANRDSDDISVLLGVGDGTFLTAVHYPASNRPGSIAIGDLDGDQVLDLAVVNRGRRPDSADAGVSVLLGIRDGTFAAAVHYAAGSHPMSVEIGNLDGDQVPDLVVANFGSHKVSVLLGVGDGTFAAAVHYPAGGGPSSVAIGDLDGDQVPDLAVANHLSANVSVLLGVGDGTFSAARNYAAGMEPHFVAIADLDGDGMSDLTVTNNATYPPDDGSVTVLLNQSKDCNENGVSDKCDIADGTSSDDDGNGVPDECEIGATLDIKPGSCPNPVNPRSRGVVPMAIVGSDSFDVTQIDVDTLTLRRADGVGGFVVPLSRPPGSVVTVEDTATPFAGNGCNCHTLGGDGIEDLSLKFSARVLVETLELDSVRPGSLVTLSVNGLLLDGTAFEASDCVVLFGASTPASSRGTRKRK